MIAEVATRKQRRRSPEQAHFLQYAMLQDPICRASQPAEHSTQGVHLALRHETRIRTCTRRLRVEFDKTFQCFWRGIERPIHGRMPIRRGWATSSSPRPARGLSQTWLLDSRAAPFAACVAPVDDRLWETCPTFLAPVSVLLTNTISLWARWWRWMKWRSRHKSQLR